MKMGKICVFSKYSEGGGLPGAWGFSYGEAGVGYDVPPTIRHNIYIHSWVKNSSLITVASPGGRFFGRIIPIRLYEKITAD
jgi:hypothetical protein